MKVNPYASLPPGFNPKSWTAGGRTLKRSGVCNFDSNEPAYQKSGLKDGAGVLIPDAQTILKSGPVTITLPRNVQFRMAGSRLDIKDNLPKRLVASKYRWTITRGTACAGDLELETHRFTREASKVATESFKFLKRSTGATLVFDITLAGGSPMAIGEAWVYLLAGNTSWTKDAANPKAHCTISVGIQEIK